MAVSQKQTPDISIIIVNYLTWETTLKLLESLGNSEYVEIIVIDNGPDDSLKNPLLAKYPSCVYQRMDKNIGYASAINQGLHIANGEWIMILNNDIQTSCEDVIQLAENTKKEHYLCAAPKLINPDGTIQNNIGHFDSFSTHPINVLFARPRFVNASMITKPTALDISTGGAILFHKSVVEKIGEWDEQFFMYFEDIDFCLRLKQAHLPILFIPDVQMKHLKSHTADQNPEQKKKNYETSKNKFIQKHRGTFINFLNSLFVIYK